MATVGNNPTTPNTGYGFALNSHAAGIPITMPEAGTSVSIWLHCDTTSTVGVRAAIYAGDGSTSDVLVDNESSEVSPGATTDSWLEIPLTGVSLTGSSSYFLAVSSDELGGVTLNRDFSQPNSGQANYYEDGEPWADPIGANQYDDGTVSGFYIYLEYTPDTGTSESIPFGTLELIGVAPSTLTVVPVKPESIPVGTLELIGVAPGTATVSNVSAEGIPAGTLTLTGFTPHPETNDYSVQSLTLTGFAPAYSIQGVVSAAIPVATFELIGFAPETLAVGLALEPIPAGTLTLTGFAPESQVTGGADEGIPSGTLELVGFAPSTVQLGTQSEGIPNNVIYLTSYAPGYNIPGQVGPRRKTGGKRGRPRPRRIVIIGGQRHVVHSYTEERYLLEQYLKRLQIEESQEEAPEVRKRPVKLVSRNISLTETRIAKLDQRVEWHRKKLRQEDDLLLSLFG